MTAAPASQAALASAAISATVPGMPGLSAFVATGPVSAAVMMGFGMCASLEVVYVVVGASGGPFLAASAAIRWSASRA